FLRRVDVAHAKDVRLTALNGFVADEELRLVGAEVAENDRPAFIFKARETMLALGGFGVGGLQGIRGVPGGLIVGGQRAATRCDRGQFRVRKAPGLPSSKTHREQEWKNQQGELHEHSGSSLSHTQFPEENLNACNNLHELRTPSMRAGRIERLPASRFSAD